MKLERLATLNDIITMCVVFTIFNIVLLGGVLYLINQVSIHTKWIFLSLKSIYCALNTPPKITLNIKGCSTTQPDAGNEQSTSYSDPENQDNQDNQPFHEAENLLMGQLWTEKEANELINLIKIGTLSEIKKETK